MTDDKGFFDVIDITDEDEVSGLIELFIEWIEHYLGSVTEFHRRYGR